MIGAPHTSLMNTDVRRFRRRRAIERAPQFGTIRTNTLSKATTTYGFTTV
jgi:hypothetical protein